MASKTSQRVGIWIIVIILAAGTLTSFVAIIFANQNSNKEAQELLAACTDYKGRLKVQSDELSAKYYPELSKFTDRVSSFDKSSVTELKTNDLKVGDGEEITEDSVYKAYYIGWNPDGKIFDQSIQGDGLKGPINAAPGGLIEGWGEGVVGMKVGGIREITIPSEKAYGEMDYSADIPPNTPLKFIVMIVPDPETLTVPNALKQYEAFLPDYISYVCQ